MEPPITNTEPKNRFVWLDAMRLTAGISMVGLHSTADSLGQPFINSPMADRIAPMLVRAIIYTARTELFLIISVFLLLMALQNRPKTYGATMLIQARRLLLPFAFWTVFYAFYELNKAGAFGYSESVWTAISNPFSWVGYILLGNVKYHMHFIPTLFGLLLFYPLFRIALRYPQLGLLVIVCLLIKRELDAFVFQQFWDTDLLPYAVRAVKILTYAGYGLVAASCLGIWQTVPSQTRVKFVPLILLFGVLLFLIKLIATQKTITTGAWPFGYTPGYWADFLMPVILFVIAMCLGHKNWPPILSKLAPFSFGIYLCHPIFLDIAEIFLAPFELLPIWLVILKISFTIPMTCLLVAVLPKIPGLGWTIGLGPLPRLSNFSLLRPKTNPSHKEI